MATHCPPASVHSFKRVRVACGRPWRAKYDGAQSWRWRTTQRHGAKSPARGWAGRGRALSCTMQHACDACALVSSSSAPSQRRVLSGHEYKAAYACPFVRSFDRRDMLFRRNSLRGASVRAFGMERLGEGVGEEGG